MQKRQDFLIVCLVLVLALFLRIPLLNSSFWLDEAAQALESARPLAQQLQIRDDFQPPLLHVWIHILIVFSREEWWLRFGAALLPSLVTIGISYVLGRRLFSRPVAILSTLFLTTSSFAIYFSQELRQYALPGMWAAISWVYIFSWVNVSQKKQSGISRSSLLGFIAVSTAGLYTSYLYPFLFITQCAVLFLFLANKRVSLVIGGVTATLFLPWLPSFLGQLQAGQSLRSTLPGWEKVVSYDQFRSVALTFGKFFFGVVDLSFSNLFLFSAGAFAFCVVTLAVFFLRKYFARAISPVEQKNVLLLLIWLIAPIFLAWLVSFFVPILQPKRVLFCLPAFYLILSYLITLPFRYFPVAVSKESAIWHLQLSTIAVSLFLLVFSVNMFGTFQYYAQPKYQRENWRDLHKQIISEYVYDAAVVFGFPEAFAPWRWYDDTHFPVVLTGTLDTTEHFPTTDFRSISQYKKVLVFDYLRDLTDRNRRVETELDALGYNEVARLTPTTPLGIVHIYQK